MSVLRVALLEGLWYHHSFGSALLLRPFVAERKEPTMTLTPRRERFVAEYLIDMNATQAAVRAGYSPKTAKAQGSRLLTNADVAAAIAEAKRERADAAGIDAAWVLREAVALYQRCVGEIKPALHPKTRRQLRDEEGNPLFTFNAAVAARALELVGKHVDVAAFKERIEVSGELSLVARLQAGRARAASMKVIDGECRQLAEPALRRA